MENGLWINLKEAGIVPDPKESINQLQELFQKKYLEEMPVYTFEERDRDEWYCSCVCGGVSGFGRDTGKIKAKKKAAYMALVQLMSAAGICKKEWKDVMYKSVL